MKVKVILRRMQVTGGLYATSLQSYDTLKISKHHVISGTRVFGQLWTPVTLEPDMIEQNGFQFWNQDEIARQIGQ